MFRVIYTVECRAQLQKLRDYIAAQESRRVAARYMKRLKAFCDELAIAPHRGEHREGIKFDQRSIGFERRVSVIFEVVDAEKVVNIAGIRYAGQQLDQASE
ncbi:MAG TPA: type II toxin-antitoxin system RelE/ParE family toxin [Candidatus Aquilonibacter sp.]|nr:type II toxin-antitoxin system RelE/ParE family toxin [Candidatus Aquilonibacter sp.]